MRSVSPAVSSTLVSVSYRLSSASILTNVHRLAQSSAWWQSNTAGPIFNLGCKSVNTIICQSPRTQSERACLGQSLFGSHLQVKNVFSLSSHGIIVKKECHCDEDNNNNPELQCKIYGHVTLIMFMIFLFGQEFSADTTIMCWPKIYPMLLLI